jgi:membrane associated rhomboid family serine protease
VLIDPTLTTPLVGSNGAIAAILGAYLLSFPKARIESILPLVIIFIPVEIPAFFYLLWWFVQQFFYGIGQLEIAGIINQFSLAYWTHGLGVLIGAGLIPLMVKRKPATAIY